MVQRRCGGNIFYRISPFIFSLFLFLFAGYMNGITQQIVERISNKKMKEIISKRIILISNLNNLIIQKNETKNNEEINSTHSANLTISDIRILKDILIKQEEKESVLFDLIFFIFRDINLNDFNIKINKNIQYSISDFYLYLILFFTILRIILFGKKIFKILKRIFLFLGILYLFRSITILLTIVINIYYFFKIFNILKVTKFKFKL